MPGDRSKIDLSKLKSYPISKRKSKVRYQDFAKAPSKGMSFLDFYKGLPDILAGSNFRNIVKAIAEACRKKKPVMVMMGSHVIKCGLNPVLIELIKKGVISSIALNGSGAIHDFEIALIGKTSEDVECALQEGSFGMAKETALYLNGAFGEAVEREIGAGEAIGQVIEEEKLPFKDQSLLYNCYKQKIPATIHVAIGTDIVHQHPSCDGANIGEASLRDFHRFIEVVSGLGNGGVVLNIGSNVILPEVFLKALNVARNLGYKVKDFTDCNFDMINHYRPYQNVVKRPIVSGGAGYTVIGHHEIMIPLLAQAVTECI
ncbi:MAG: hypothetical protein ABIG92_04135 [Candidatus Omnitrophota bacterium]